jgi:hypothetical protein
MERLSSKTFLLVDSVHGVRYKHEWHRKLFPPFSEASKHITSIFTVPPSQSNTSVLLKLILKTDRYATEVVRHHLSKMCNFCLRTFNTNIQKVMILLSECKKSHDLTKSESQ